MSLYEYSNSVSDFQSLISSVPENTSDMKDKMKGELFLSLGVPTGYMAAKAYVGTAVKNIRAKFAGGEEAEAGAEGAEAEEAAPGVIPEGFMGPTAQQQMLDFDPEEGMLGAGTGGEVAGTEAAAATKATGAAAGTGDAVGAVAVLAEGGEITEEATALGGPEVGAVVGVGVLVASAVIGIIDLFKHHADAHIIANLPQLGV